MGRGRASQKDLGTTQRRSNVSKEPTVNWTEVRAGIASLGLNSYEVGGSIRNEIIGKEPNDIDVCVVGSDYQGLVEACKKNNVLINPLEVEGQQIGARIFADWTPADGIELALARKEVSTGEGHTQFSIETNPDVLIEEDLLRRDFTCNAIAQVINSDGSLGEKIDPTGGEADLQAGVLRAVSDRTLSEDPLRVLRGFVRIAADGLTPDEKTKQQMLAQSKNLRPDGPLSSERIYKEVDKIIRAPNAANSLRQMRNADNEGTLFKDVFPELAPMVGFDQESKYHDLDVDEHCFRALDRACSEGMPSTVRWAALLHDSGKPISAWRGRNGNLHYYWNKKVPESKAHDLEGAKISRQLLHRLKAPNDLQDQVELLVRYHMFGTMDNIQSRDPKKTALKTRQLIQKVGRKNIDNLVLLRRCDYGGKGEIKDGWDDNIKLFQKYVDQAKQDPIEIKDLRVNGNDVISAGAQGPEIGQVLKELLHRVTLNPEDNNPEKLKKWIKTLVKA